MRLPNRLSNNGDRKAARGARYNVFMSADKSLRLSCPECDAEIVVDLATGQVVFHKKVESAVAGGKTLESLMQDMEKAKDRTEQRFQKEKAAHEDRDRLMEERFRQAMSHADDDDESPPLRPFDLD